MKKQVSLVLSLCILFFSAIAGVQPPDSNGSVDISKLPYKKKLKYADDNFALGNNFLALDLYLQLSNDKPEDPYLNYQLAECHRLARDYKSAEAAYRKVVESNVVSSYPLTHFYHAQMLQMQGKYPEAKSAYNQFVSLSPGEKFLSFLEIAKKQSEACEFALSAAAKPSTFTVTHIEPPLNKPYTEFSPRVYNGAELYYASLNNDSVLNAKFLRNGLYLSHIYRSTLQNGNWTSGDILDKPINSDDKHSGNIAFSPDGNRMYFTFCSDNGENNIKCSIYLSTKKGNNWSEPVALTSAVNADNSSNTQPAVAKGEASFDILYFASNRNGGKGGFDLYSAEVQFTGTAANVKNLGEVINTEGDEITPFYHEAKKTLFFSSNSMIGFGGFDIYGAKGDANNGFSTPVNIGAPVNSPADDIYYTAGEDKKISYLVSNRPGTIGLKSETCCDDIFRVKDTYIPKFAAAGSVTELGEDSKPSDRKLTEVKVEVFDVTNGAKKLLTTQQVDKLSDFFINNLEVDHNYEIKFSKEGYFALSENISTVGLEEADTFNINTGLEKIRKDKSYTLSKIYYAYKSAELTEDSKLTLDELYSLLIENPKMIIELSSHTDSIGSDSYNQRLSQERAESCVNYLISKGISKDRIVAKGYGESKPIAPNSSGKGKDNPDGRAKNRRTEYKVIGELSNEGDKIQFKE